jgi:hypothetical protein
MAKRGRKGPDVFDTVRKLLTPTESGETHQCDECGALLKLGKNKLGSFKNDVAKRHIGKKHPNLEATLQQRREEEERQRRAVEKKQVTLMTMISGRPTKELLAGQLKTAIFHYYVYSRQHISKQNINDTYFKAVVRAAFRFGGGNDNVDLPFINKKELLDWCREELNVLRWHVRRYISELVEAAQGNKCCQGQHDTATLKNGLSFLAGGLQFVDPDDLGENVILCMGFSLTAGKDSDSMAEQVRRQCLFMTGMCYTSLAYATISDHAALGVARCLGHDGWGCDMHDVSKVRRCRFVASLSFARV